MATKVLLGKDRVLSTSLVSYDSNRYSVDSSAVGRTVMLRAYAEKVAVVDDGAVIAQHPRLFGRHEVRDDPWHYVSVLERKLGALRNDLLMPRDDYSSPRPSYSPL